MSNASTEPHQRVVSVELVNDCNNACVHCYNFWRGADGVPAGHAGRLDRATLARLLDGIARDIPLTHVALTGGEPLLHPELAGIVGDIVDRGLSPIVITNGSLVSESLMNSLPSGLNFELSILGSSAERHDRVAGRRVFERVLEAASLIERHRCFMTMVFVASSLNVEDVQGSVELGVALGARGIMYNRVNVSRARKADWPTLMPTRGQIAESLGTLSRMTEKYGISVSCSVPIPPCVVPIDDFPKLHFGWCPRGGENAYYTIDTRGRLRPCNHSSRLLGDLLAESYASILSRNPAEELWSTFPEECVDCESVYRELCLGGCPAAAEEYFGAPGRADPIRLLAAGGRS